MISLPPLRVLLAYLGACVIWGSTWMMIKIGLRGAPLGEHEEPDGGEIQTRLPPALQQVDRDRDRDREGGQQVQRREQPERHRGQPSRRAR